LKRLPADELALTGASGNSVDAMPLLNYNMMLVRDPSTSQQAHHALLPFMLLLLLLLLHFSCMPLQHQLKVPCQSTCA
jgi:hypothetical protein